VTNKARVLIVDDDKDLSSSLSLILNRKGYEVTTVDDGEHAVEEARKLEFDLILIDVLMPGKSGLDTLRELREVAPQARTVVMTGYAVSGLVGEAMQIGVDGVLYKPFDVDVVVDTLMSQDVIRLYEGYLKTIWDRMMQVLGPVATQTVFGETLKAAAGQEASLLGGIEVTEEGVSLERLRRGAEPGHSPELRRQLQSVLTVIFDVLGAVAGNVLVAPLLRQFSNDLKGSQS
jgi:CheY-like chemotaxis protein